MDELIISKMRTFKEWKDKSADDVKALIRRGNEIQADDDKAEDAGTIRSHYSLSEFDQDAMATASQYNIMVELKAGRDTDASEEE